MGHFKFFTDIDQAIEFIHDMCDYNAELKVGVFFPDLISMGKISNTAVGDKTKYPRIKYICYNPNAIHGQRHDVILVVDQHKFNIDLQTLLVIPTMVIDSKFIKNPMDRIIFTDTDFRKENK